MGLSTQQPSAGTNTRGVAVGVLLRSLFRSLCSALDRSLRWSTDGDGDWCRGGVVAALQTGGVELPLDSLHTPGASGEHFGEPFIGDAGQAVTVAPLPSREPSEIFAANILSGLTLRPSHSACSNQSTRSLESALKTAALM